MRVRLLGTAAGGGYPQWNCACRLCVGARSGNARFQRRLHASLAISATGERWYLINATPDVAHQIESHPALHPGPGVRKTCLAGVFLTDAELDHTLGLLVLREGTPLEVYGSAAVLGAIETAFPVRRILESYAPFHWTEITPGEPFLIDEGSLTVKAFRLGVKKPRYVADDPTSATEGDWVMGFRFEDQQTHGVLVYAPGVERWTPELLAALQGVQAIFVDGTFWSDCELADAGVGSLTAHEMGHLPIGGPRGSAQHLARLPAARKVYIHINNTNPVLDEKSAERRSLVERGIEIGFDGMELEV